MTERRARSEAVSAPGNELSKVELQQLADQLLDADPTAVDRCLVFFAAETRGLWHNRARAKIARRLKHWQLSQAQKALVLEVVLRRLTSGRFTEQFKDQLRLGSSLDRQRLLEAAHICLASPKEYVRRYAGWIIATFGPAAPPT